VTPEGREKTKLGGMAGGTVSLAKAARNDSRVGAGVLSAGVALSSVLSSAGVGAAASADLSLDSQAEAAVPKPEPKASELRKPQKSSDSSARPDEGGDEVDGRRWRLWRWGGRSEYIVDMDVWM
jgi:hypothetical protein